MIFLSNFILFESSTPNKKNHTATYCNADCKKSKEQKIALIINFFIFIKSKYSSRLVQG